MSSMRRDAAGCEEDADHQARRAVERRSVVYRILDADTGVMTNTLGRLAKALKIGVAEFFRE